ncbi:MAG TPA: hypothetical protein DIT05_07525 [Morganella sp. (in: Bacteria)]|uniref:YfgM family protein n=1 Tax=Morganella psychrotolerans TaxID=368603 RepID=UPI000EB945BA|nr:hypothetical protein [Morganella sp. (in: enterobacteria)]
MEVYTTENEQVSVLKNFFVENGKAIAAGLIIGIGGIVGWNYYQSHQVTQLQDAAVAYEAATVVKGTAEEQLTRLKLFAKEANNTYGAFAGLDLAQKSVESNDLPGAEAALTAALPKAENEELKDLINARLARVQLGQGNADAALSTAGNIKGKGWAAYAQDIRGDALLHKGDVKGAQEAYTTGIQSEGAGTIKSVMTFKLDNLAG